MTITSQRITTNGIQLDVHQAGPEDGELVILLHGFPEHGLAWQKQIEFLATQGYRVWAPDQRGYAGSDKPKGIKQYHLDELAKDILGLIDASGDEQASIVGHDWGGAVCWWLGCNYPERLKRIAVLNVPHNDAFTKLVFTSLKQLVKSWYMFFFAVPKLPEWLLSQNNYRRMRGTLLGSSATGTFSKETLQAYIDNWSQVGSLSAMLNWYRSAVLSPPKPRLKKVPVPTTILWGRQDSFLQEELAQLSGEYCEQLSATHYLDDTGHWLAHEKPKQVNEILCEFLAS